MNRYGSYFVTVLAGIALIAIALQTAANRRTSESPELDWNHQFVNQINSSHDALSAESPNIQGRSVQEFTQLATVDDSSPSLNSNLPSSSSELSLRSNSVHVEQHAGWQSGQLANGHSQVISQNGWVNQQAGVAAEQRESQLHQPQVSRDKPEFAPLPATEESNVQTATFIASAVDTGQNQVGYAAFDSAQESRASQSQVSAASYESELENRSIFVSANAESGADYSSTELSNEPNDLDQESEALGALEAAESNSIETRVASLDPQSDKKKKRALPSLGGKSKKAPKEKIPAVLSGYNEFKLAAQPELGAHFKDDTPLTDPTAHLVPHTPSNFSPDPQYPGLAYEPYGLMDVYQGKTLNDNQRPLIEIGRPWYQLGQLSPGSSILGFHNNFVPQFIIFGDSRTAFASNRQNGNSETQIATALNLDLDLKLTSTERFHAFISPNSGGGKFTRYSMDDDEFITEADATFDFGYFEGDLGAIVGGLTNKTLPFDMPFAVGVIPLFFQNGVWMNDAFLGFAVTRPARNSAKFDITNMDFTFFAGYDKVVSDAFPGDDSAARIIGIASFIEAMNGYFEIDYAFLDDRTFDNRSYHNIGIGFTRRYGRFLSNSTRVIVNAGQDSSVVENTADGVLLLSENSLITGAPSTVVPYMNFFAGFDRPQSAARAGAAGGVLVNTGILFESDNLTNYPTLDASANDTYGMAMGLNLLASDFSQQLVVEAAMLGVMGDSANRRAKGDQYGVGVRYQIPVTNSVIFRTDAMYGFLRGDEDVNGVRMELRKKF